MWQSTQKTRRLSLLSCFSGWRLIALVIGFLVVLAMVLVLLYERSFLDLGFRGGGLSEASTLELILDALPGQDLALKLHDLRSTNKAVDIYIETSGFDFYDLDAKDSTIFALDPFVLLIDERPSKSLIELADTASLQDFMNELPVFSAGSQVSFGIAGNNDHDLLAFILYLAGEILPADYFGQLVKELRSSDGEIPPALADVLQYIRILVQNGVIARNWTNWDHIALLEAMKRQEIMVVFAPRSFFKNLSRDTSRFLLQKRLPGGRGRRSYFLAGAALRLTAEGAFGAGSLHTLTASLRHADFQHELEKGSLMSPVGGVSPFFDLNHRNFVTWVQNAEYYLSIDTTPLSPELMAALRFALR